MPGKYAVTGAQDVTTASPGDSSLGITGGTDQRLQLYDFTSGFGGTPADNVIETLLRRYTAEGTASAVTPQALDPADPASRANAVENHTAEPTYTAGSELFHQFINQRATYRWVAAPGGEIVVPASASNGLGFTVIHASYTGSHEVTAHFVD